MNKKIVAICGVIGSGKNTFAKAFIDNGYIDVSFAENLKDAVSAIFGWDRTLLEGDTKESREFRETVDVFWSEKLGKDITPRFILQNYGTDIMRKYFHDNIWIYSLEKKINNIKSDKIIITDCRFPNEIKMIKDNFGIIIEVQKELPEWYQYCKEYNNAKVYDIHWNLEVPSDKFKIHSSEYSWIGINKPKYIVQNNGTVLDLEEKALEIIKELDNTPKS